MVKKETWEKEFSNGKWDYLDSTPAERSRSAIIGMYCKLYSPNGNILDVGCGLGTLADFLEPIQIRKYLGLDISEEAIARGNRKNLNFQIIDFQSFKKNKQYDVIIFNEVLYYMDEERSIDKALDLISIGGKIIVSMFNFSNNIDKQIWLLCNKKLQLIDSITVVGKVNNDQIEWTIKVFEPK